MIKLNNCLPISSTGLVRHQHQHSHNCSHNSRQHNHTHSHNHSQSIQQYNHKNNNQVCCRDSSIPMEVSTFYSSSNHSVEFNDYNQASNEGLDNGLCEGCMTYKPEELCNSCAFCIDCCKCR